MGTAARDHRVSLALILGLSALLGLRDLHLSRRGDTYYAAGATLRDCAGQAAAAAS